MWSFKNRKVFMLLTFGLLVHLLILKAAFDIYFSSPIDHGMTPIKSTTDPPAKRLVLIVADGLRADAIYGENQTEIAPNLSNIRKTRGSWGISHTRVPTESRPGHVALLGGIFEDPSAILKGWKANPVDFDSVINQSTNAWCWGGPSIINMFNKDKLSHIHLHSYDASMEDFGNNNTIGLDKWVFEEVQQFIKKYMSMRDCPCDECRAFKMDGNFFFLHLLGTDTAGHAFKPESEGYINNIKFVDGIIPQIEELFEDAFPDRSTAYVFTADHGMTNWGSHGAGSNHETQTPLIAWGAGIRMEDAQKDVQQIDIAPLLSALIGISYPLNSLGQLPEEYLDTSSLTLAEMQISNVLQLKEIFTVKRDKVINTTLKFIPFQGVSEEDLEEQIENLKDLAKRFQFSLLRIEAEALMDFLVQGADYYHNYYQLPLLISVTIGLVAWIIYLATYNINLRRHFPGRQRFIHCQIAVFPVLYCNNLFLTYVQNLPWMYYLYSVFPILMIQLVVCRYRQLLEALKQVKNFGFFSALLHIGLYLVGLQLLIQGFVDRENYSYVMYIMAAFIFWSQPLRQSNSNFSKFIWIACCCILSIFPYLPVMQTKFNIYSYVISFGLWWKAFEHFIIPNLDQDDKNKFIRFQHFMLVMTPFYVFAVQCDFIGSDAQIKKFAPIWPILPVFIIPLSPTRVYSRLTSIFLGCGTYYMMVTSNYESLFLICYIFLLYSWMSIESRCFGYASIVRVDFDRRVKLDHRQTSDDFRRAFFFICLIFIGFFGTGNIASISSFDPMWARCFLTVFSPFKMSAIILLKIMVPFLFATCVYRAVNTFRQGYTLHLFCIVLMFSDLMLLELLYYITNVGSWLEIGMSLSQFIIMEAFVIILLLLYGIGYLLTAVYYP